MNKKLIIALIAGAALTGFAAPGHHGPGRGPGGPGRGPAPAMRGPARGPAFRPGNGITCT